MTGFTDTQRIDALDQLGLCVVGIDTLTSEGWSRTWVCTYGAGLQAQAPTIREAIDLAMLDLGAGSTAH